MIPMSPSQACYDLIKSCEGCRLTAYQDSGGIWTIGYGSTSGVREGMVIDHDMANVRLWNDVQGAVACVDRKVGPQLSQNQFDALVSFVFNVGCAAFTGSTLLRLLNAGETEAAGQQFGRWVHDSAGDVLPGLIARRAKEAALFSGAAAATPQIGTS